MNEYVIIGDTERYKDCLVYICGASLRNAKNILNRMLNEPTEYDAVLTEGHTNLRIKEVEEKDCWWNHDWD